MSDNGKSEIGLAILGVMGEVGYVQKESKGGLNYSFASEAALIAALRPAMIKHGVISHIQDLPSIEQAPYVTSNGKAMNRTIAHGIVRFSHPASGTFTDVHAMGEGADVGDKAGNKAATGLLKYALRQTFLIETGDDPDSTSSDTQAKKKGTTKKKATKKTTTQKTTASKDPATLFWTKATELEFTKEQGMEIVDNAGGDMKKAYDKLAEQYP